MSDAAALVSTNLHEVFNERDPEKRAAAIARLYAAGLVFTAEAEPPVEGAEALQLLHSRRHRGLRAVGPAAAEPGDVDVELEAVERLDKEYGLRDEA